MPKTLYRVPREGWGGSNS